MKRNIFITILSFTVLNCSAQKNYDVNTISFSIGPSFAVGDFAKKDINNKCAGFAKTGEQINISFENKLNKNFGIAAMLSGQNNPISTSSLEKQFSQQKFYSLGFYSGNTQSPPPTSQYTIYPNWKFEKKSWLSAAFLLGGFIDAPLNQTKSISFTAKVMVGIIYVSAPKFSGKSTSDTASAQIMQNFASGFGLAYLAEAGLKFNISKNIYFLSGINYISTNQIKFKNGKEAFTSVNTGSFPYAFGSTKTGTTSKQNISAINLNLWIGLKL